MIFDDVEVPRDRVFIDANLDVYNTVMTTGWSPNIMQQTMIRAQTKLEFAWGLALRMAEAINAAVPQTMQHARRDLDLSPSSRAPRCSPPKPRRANGRQRPVVPATAAAARAARRAADRGSRA